MDDLERLADLIRKKNALDAEIASITGRPALIGHVGESIASKVFGIVLEESASCKRIDGRFSGGRLAAGTAERQVDADAGTVRPWVIEAVYLLDGPNLVGVLRSREVKLGVATSVASELWEAAEVYQVQRSPMLELSDWQRRMLSLFGSAAVC